MLPKARGQKKLQLDVRSEPVQYHHHHHTAWSVCVVFLTGTPVAVPVDQLRNAAVERPRSPSVRPCSPR